MTRGLLARKVGMTQVFTGNGVSVPVTVLEVTPNRVVQLKTAARDGYDAVQIGWGEKVARRANRPETGHFKAAGLRPMRRVAELRNAGTPEMGATFGVDLFSEGQHVDVTGTTQGKGFAGLHKRHNFGRGPVTHGSHNIRQAGSIGSVDAARTFRGLKMAGQMGNVQRTVRGLTIVRVDSERNLLLIRGAVPGARNAVVLVRDSDREATL